jgi:hypothetical protein
MRRMILVVAVAVAFASTAFAQANPPKKQVKPVPKKVEEMKIEGQVVSVDAIANTIVLKQTTGNDTLAVDKAAKITDKGKAIRLADLAKGSEVAAHYKMVSGKKVAVMIDVIPQKPAAPKKEEPKKTEKTTPPAAPAKKK